MLPQEARWREPFLRMFHSVGARTAVLQSDSGAWACGPRALQCDLNEESHEACSPAEISFFVCGVEMKLLLGSLRWAWGGGCSLLCS